MILNSLFENMNNTYCYCERSEAISLINNKLERLPQGFQPFAMTLSDILLSPESKIQSLILKLKTQNSKLKTQNSKLKFQISLARD